MRMTMTLTTLSLSLVLACADDGGDVGDGYGDDAGDQGSGEDETGSTGSDEASDASTDESTTANESSTSTDESSTGSDTSSTSSDESSTSSEGTDTSGETGDPSCEDDQYLGAGIGSDDWGLGSLCDDIWVCASADQVAALEALDPIVMCEPGMGCPDQHCQLSYQVIVDQPTLDRVCEALLLPGIDIAYCSVYGP